MEKKRELRNTKKRYWEDDSKEKFNVLTFEMLLVRKRSPKEEQKCIVLWRDWGNRIGGLNGEG